MYARTRVRELHKLTIKTIRKMKKKQILAVLLLMVAGMQTAWGQGFRVYQSDGTQLQFSLSTDSIVFDNGLSGDEVFGPFTPVNQCVTKTWYKSKTETVTFNADGTTDYMEGATYKFFPYQGNLVIYNGRNAAVDYYKVLEVTAEKMIVSTRDGSSIMEWSVTVPILYVSEIVLSETSVALDVDATKTLTATVLPDDADNREITWESSDESVAEVNQNGRIIANAEGICTITCRATDGSGVYAECRVIVGRPYVDLGLPSGTLWAACNVGASIPEEYGDHFAWGEINPKSEYSWKTYQWSKDYYNTMTKYCKNYGYNGFTDDLTELLPEDDAATANWGSDWQMPSTEQIDELINSDYTTTEWTTQNGVNGRLITSVSNGKSIFLPATGYRYEEKIDLSNDIGYYWTRSLNTTYSNAAYCLTLQSESIKREYKFRLHGFSVRPVRVQE